MLSLVFEQYNISDWPHQDETYSFSIAVLIGIFISKYFLT